MCIFKHIYYYVSKTIPYCISKIYWDQKTKKPIGTNYESRPRYGSCLHRAKFWAYAHYWPFHAHFCFTYDPYKSSRHLIWWYRCTILIFPYYISAYLEKKFWSVLLFGTNQFIAKCHWNVLNIIHFCNMFVDTCIVTRIYSIMSK